MYKIYGEENNYCALILHIFSFFRVDLTKIHRFLALILQKFTAS